MVTIKNVSLTTLCTLTVHSENQLQGLSREFTSAEILGQSVRMSLLTFKGIHSMEMAATFCTILLLLINNWGEMKVGVVLDNVEKQKYIYFTLKKFFKSHQS